MTKALETDFEAKATLADERAGTAMRNAAIRLRNDRHDEAVSYLRDAIDAIRSAEGWRAAAQALADARVKT